MPCLIVVDIQNDFLPGGALAVAEGDRVIPIINGILDRFDLVVATQDWHPADHLSFAANHPGHKIGDVVDVGGLPQVLWPVHCVQNTPGAAFAPSLNTRRFARIFQKGIDRTIDSYSTFFDNAHRRSTGLAEYLHERDVTEVHIAGLATDYCVKFSAFDAIAERFRTTVIEDACRAVNLNPDDGQRALHDMRSHGATITTSDRIRA